MFTYLDFLTFRKCGPHSYFLVCACFSKCELGAGIIALRLWLRTTTILKIAKESCNTYQIIGATLSGNKKDPID